MSPDHPTLAELIGTEFRRIRKEQGFTLDEFAGQMRLLGFRWSTSRVVELETGKVSPTLGMVAAMSSALLEITGKHYKATDFLPGVNSGVEIAPGVVVEIAALRRALEAGDVLLVSADYLEQFERENKQRLEGDRAAQWLKGDRWQSDANHDAFNRHELSDRRAAQTLRLTLNELVVASVSLWGRGFSAERNARAQPDANAQTLGRISRELLDELREYIGPRRKGKGRA